MLSDAVDDFDYLCILKEEMNKAKSSGKAPELVKEAEKLFKDEFFNDNNLSGEMLLKRRNQVGCLIERFRKAAK